MAAHVQTKTTAGATGTSASVAITSTLNNFLVLSIAAFSTTLSTFTVNSISDTHNTWSFSNTTSNQNPPVGQSSDGSVQGLSLIAAVGSATAITNISVGFSRSLDFIDLVAYEFSGVPSGSIISVAAANGTNTTGTTKTTPSVTVPASASLAVATATNEGASITSVTSGWTLDGGTDNTTAYRISPPSGATTVTFTGGSQNWPSSAILVVGPGTTPPHSGLLMIGIV